MGYNPGMADRAFTPDAMRQWASAQYARGVGHAAMRQALDSYTPSPRPTLGDIVERIGPLRNKTANEAPAAPPRERGRRRG